MSGELLYEGHECDPPTGQAEGAIWRCDCGKYWRSRTGGWWSMDMIAVLFARANGKIP